VFRFIPGVRESKFVIVECCLTCVQPSNVETELTDLIPNRTGTLTSYGLRKISMQIIKE